MKQQKIFVAYMLIMPIYLIVLSLLVLSSWTIERFQLKKQVPPRERGGKLV